MPWIYRSDGLARLGLDKFIVDEETSRLLILAAIGGRKLHEEI
jgi:hypothetical protein